jgi:hypothetical protein
MLRCTCCDAAYDTLRAMGHMSDGDGNALPLCNCPACASTFAGRAIDGASVCQSCMRPVTGRTDDVKVCVLIEGEPVVLCQRCAHDSPMARPWLEDRTGAPPSSRPMLVDDGEDERAASCGR